MSIEGAFREAPPRKKKQRREGPPIAMELGAATLKLILRREGLIVLGVAALLVLWPAISGGIRDLLRPASQRQAEALLVQAAAEIKAGDKEEARDLLREAKDLVPPFKDTRAEIDKRLAEVCQSLGDKLYHKDEFAQAAALYEEALEAGGDSADLRGDLGMALLFEAERPGPGREEKLERALESLEEARGIEPDNPKWLWWMAKCHEAMGNEQRAADLRQKIVEVDTLGIYRKAAARALGRG